MFILHWIVHGCSPGNEMLSTCLELFSSSRMSAWQAFDS